MDIRKVPQSCRILNNGRADALVDRHGRSELLLLS